MAKEIIYRCDKAGCNLTRPAISETNHWFVVRIASDAATNRIIIDPFVPDFNENFDDKYWSSLIFCGEAHALEYIGTELPKLHPTRERSESGKLVACGCIQDGLPCYKACHNIQTQVGFYCEREAQPAGKAAATINKFPIDKTDEYESRQL